MKVVAITGASSGIGRATAKYFNRRGWKVYNLSRRLSGEAGIINIAADVTVEEEVKKAFAQIRSESGRLDLLVNNAGFGVAGNYLSSPWETHAHFLQVMVTAVSELTWRFLPQIRKNRGRILNVASFAGLAPGSSGQTLYAGAKSFLIKFSESLALENARYGVNACALCPGFTYSEFHDVTGTRALVSRLPRWMWLDAEDVARQGVEGVEAGRLIVVPGAGYKMLRLAFKYLPDFAVHRMMARNSRRMRDDR